MIPERSSTRASASVAEAVSRMVGELNDHIEEIAERAVRTIFAEIEAYDPDDAGLVEDVRVHVLMQYTTSLRIFAQGRPVTLDDLDFVEVPATRRVHRVSLADFMHAFRLGEAVLWGAVRELAVDEGSRRVALGFATHLIESGGLSSSHAAASYAESARLLALTGERIGRDLLEDLLDGREPKPGPRLDAAEAAGLTPGARYLVIAAQPVTESVDEHALRAAAGTLARAARSVADPLVVLRHGEIVILIRIDDCEPRDALKRIQSAQRQHASQGLELAVGISTVYSDLAMVGEAYGEACAARDHVATGGVQALNALSTFEYLTSRHDPTAGRLVKPTIARFIAEDEEQGGVLIETLERYVGADLNARAAAEALHVHVNTMRYRLARITELTGCNLRSVNDLLELLIAIRLARSEAG